MRPFNPAKAVTVRRKEGESKEAVILRKLGCTSLAQAINKYGLQDEAEPWAKLEGIAVGEIQLTRAFSKVRRAIRKLI